MCITTREKLSSSHFNAFPHWIIIVVFIKCRGHARKKVGNFNTMNIKFGIVGNDNLGGVGRRGC